MRGTSSTPTLSDFAWINEVLLNLGSSAMVSLLASTLPERMLKLKLPTLTDRPRAEVRFDSICGRKLLTLIKNGRAMAIASNRAMTIPTILRMFLFIEGLHGPTLKKRDRKSGAHSKVAGL